MPAPILATKLYLPPSRSQIVRRPGLFERLNAGLGRKLTLVSAPAGFGKTTLLSEWISDLRGQNEAFELPAGAAAEYPQQKTKISNLKFCWFSLDEADSDLPRFLAYLVAALQTIQPTLGENLLAALQTPQPPPTETLLTGLLNEISANPEHFLLVLDDYHLIDSKAVDLALIFLVEHLPPPIHLVIASREDPNLPLPRLRARAQLAELRAADLRFTPAEAAEFLNRGMGLNLSAEDVSALESRTEGWIAGLQLAALSMQGQKDIPGFIQSFTGSHHFVLDYLLEEVLNQQPANIQNFLLRTSILNRMCGSLCEAILGEAELSGQATLEALEHANLFIVPLDDERRWYRYHHLFGDLLRQRLRQSPSPLPLSQRERGDSLPLVGEGSGMREFHLRASQWYEENGDLPEAFHHALAAGDFERAARLAEAAWQSMDESFQTAAWLGWVKKLPETVIRARPALCVQLGWAFSDAGEPETSEIHLQNAEQALAGAADRAEFRPLPGSIALARAYNAQIQGNLTTTVKYAELALQLIPEDDFYRRSQAAITLEFTHWAGGDLEAALRAMNDWIGRMQKIGNHVFVVASAFAVADIQIVQGHLRDAEKTYRQAIQLAAVQGQEAEQITAHHHLGLALLAHEQGDDESAAQYLQKAAERGQQTTLVDWPHRWQLAQAQLKESDGELDAALALLEEAKRVYIKNPVPDLRPVEALKVRVYLKQRRLDKAQAWVSERGLSVDNEFSYLHEFEYLMLARVLIAAHSFAGVNELLEHLLKAAEGQKRLGSVLEILVTQTLAHQAQGNLSLALASLDRALALAEPEGYFRIFVDEGEVMRLLILDFRLTIENRTHPLLGYVDHLLAAFPLQSPNHPITQSLNPLTERELEILRLVAQGLSNTEISQRLYLALSTVKGHNLRIFDKLQAQNRTEAVARARELGLL